MSDEKLHPGMGERLWKLKLVLDETVEFPTEYIFKFIVPLSEIHHVLFHLKDFDIEQKSSSNGNYISVTAKKVFSNSDDIIRVYRSVGTIKGLIAL
jgi:putative lipoic acid-binding regulatory protein